MGVNDYRISVETTLSDAAICSIADEVMLTKPPRFGPEGWRAKFTWRASPPEAGALRAYRLQSAGAVAEMMAAKTVRVQNSLMEIWTEEGDGRRTVTVAGASPAVNFGTNMGFMVFPRYLTLFEQRFSSGETSPSEASPGEPRPGETGQDETPSVEASSGEVASERPAMGSISARNEAARKAPPPRKQEEPPTRERTETYALVAKVRPDEVSRNPFLPAVIVGETVQLTPEDGDGERHEVSSASLVQFAVHDGGHLDLKIREKDLPLSVIVTDSRLVVLSGVRPASRIFKARRGMPDTITIGQVAYAWIRAVGLAHSGPGKGTVVITCTHVCDGNIVVNSFAVLLPDETSARNLADRLVRCSAQARLASSSPSDADRLILEQAAAAGIEAPRRVSGQNTWEWSLPNATPWCWRTTYVDDTKVRQINDGNWSGFGRLGPRFPGSSAFPEVLVEPSGSRLVRRDEAAPSGAHGWPTLRVSWEFKDRSASEALDRGHLHETGELFVTSGHVAVVFHPDPGTALGAPPDGVGLRADVASFRISWIHELQMNREEGKEYIFLKGTLERRTGAEFGCNMLFLLSGNDVEEVAREIVDAVIAERRAGSSGCGAQGDTRYTCTDEDLLAWAKPRVSTDGELSIWTFQSWMTVHED